jgi:prolyl oligopeptidase
MSSQDPRPPYPHAKRSGTSEIIGQHKVPDPYRWLESADSEQTRNWLTAQAKLLGRSRKDWPQLARYNDSMHRLTAFDLLSAPVWRGNQAFLTHRAADAQHIALAVEESGNLRTLVDPQIIDPTAQTTLGRWAPSADGSLMAYELATGGHEEFSLHVIDTQSGRYVDGPIAGCRYSAIAWIPGQNAFYYTRHRDAGDRQGVYLHRIGEQAPETEVFGAGFGDTAQFEISLDPDGHRFVIIASTGLSATNQIWWADLDHAALDTPDLHRIDALQDGWSVAWPVNGGTCYVLTDDDAPRGRLVTISAPAADDPAEISTLLPQDTAAVLESFAVLDSERLEQPLLLSLTSLEGRSLIERHDLRTGELLGAIGLPGPGVISDLTFRPNGGHEAWFTYSDPTTPETVYHYDAVTGQCAPWRTAKPRKRPPVAFTEENYRSTDGAQVRLLLTRPADAPPGPLPTILQGYGAFGEPQVADYYAAALAWAERGGLFAVACVRGGGENGESWHQAGSRENKQQGLDDFAAAAQYLQVAGHTTAEELGAFGQSAGGLLVAAVMTQQPMLFKAAVCTSALLDMARYELTGFGPYWTEEFGSRTIPDELDWLLSYSPYHHVRPGTAYPAVLLGAMHEDARVDPLHTRKMCAALQHATAASFDDCPVLLRYQTSAGHGEQSREDRLSYFADVLAFFDHHLKQPDSPAPGSDIPVT